MAKSSKLESGKFNIGQLLKAASIVKILTFNNKKAQNFQARTLHKLLLTAMETTFGIEHDFVGILNASDIKEQFKKIPIRDYLGMKPYWQKSYEGEENVAWPGTVSYFALSSGTTDSGSKYIPVTDDMLKAVKKAGRRQLLQIAKTDFPKDYLAKDYLFVGGSTDLEFNGNNFSGDLSGITTGNLPFWIQRFSKPEPFIKEQKIWEDKIELMVQNAPNWDVTMLAGVPAWIQILFEKIIKEYNLNNIHDMWPNLSIYVHGGVSFKPYKKSFEKYLASPLKYFETYLASEGFIAFQTKESSEGMRLIFKNGIYYEFVPFCEQNFDANGDIKPNATTVDLGEVELDKDYAIVISTCSGAWRYLLGDTIKFTDIEQCEIEITGRTKHFLSLCGEHLSVDNMNDAVSLLSDELGVDINEFTVKGVKEELGFEHHWYLSCDSNIAQTNLDKKLDAYLCKLNDDYKVERQHALKNIKVTVLPKSVFIDWMEMRGKVGSQNKFPRVLNDKMYENWLSFINKSKTS